jgi:hypothetical protein
VPINAAFVGVMNNRLRVFESGVLGKLFGSEREEVNREVECCIVRSSRFVPLNKHCRVQMKEDKMGGTCGTYGGEQNYLPVYCLLCIALFSCQCHCSTAPCFYLDARGHGGQIDVQVLV